MNSDIIVELPRTKQYISKTACQTCGTNVRYKRGGQCAVCLKGALEKERAEWGTNPNREFPEVPDTVEKARSYGLSWVWDSHVRMCPNGPHAFATGLSTGRCVACRTDNHDHRRKEALGSGEASYEPYFACNKCGGGKRSTGNNKCWGCHPQERKKAESSSEFMRKNPDLVIPRAEAASRGLKVYRTGKPCTYGHMGFRHVNGNGCIDCRKGVQGFPVDPWGAAPPEPAKPVEIFLQKHNRACITRQEAIQYGFKFYKTRNLCKYGHLSLRRVKGGACVDCQKGVQATTSNSKSEKFMREFPGAFINREEATRAGLEVFKHGDFPLCHHDSGWRYLETNECVECAKENGTVPGLKL